LGFHRRVIFPEQATIFGADIVHPKRSVFRDAELFTTLRKCVPHPQFSHEFYRSILQNILFDKDGNEKGAALNLGDRILSFQVVCHPYRCPTCG
jgi:hypothetical protein